MQLTNPFSTWWGTLKNPGLHYKVFLAWWLTRFVVGWAELAESLVVVFSFATIHPNWSMKVLSLMAIWPLRIKMKEREKACTGYTHT